MRAVAALLDDALIAAAAVEGTLGYAGRQAGTPPSQRRAAAGRKRSWNE